MRTTSLLSLAAVAAAASVSALPSAGEPSRPSPLARRRPQLSAREVEDLVIRKNHYPTCSPAGTAGKDNGILLPKKGATVKVNHPTTFYFCSPTYHETRSVSYDILAMNSDFPNSGVLVASDVKQSTLNVTLTDSWYNMFAVFERQTGYGTDELQFALFNQSINPVDDA